MYNLDEIGILPSDSPIDIVSRKECDVYTENGTLPIFVAPMTSVVDKDNYKLFSDNNVIPIIPRRLDNLEFRLAACNHVWCAFSLTEFEDYFCKESADECPLVLIDIANGHMKKVYDLVKTAKSIWSDIKIMIGNIAHPKMYWYAYEAGVDYVRCSIGSGTCCTSGVKTGVHSSMEYILSGIKKIQNDIRLIPQKKPFPKVIADGGISTIDRAIKCLALGADYVMIGKMFAQCEEACGTVRVRDNAPEFIKELDCIVNSQNKEVFSDTYCPEERLYYGMASKRGQKDISNTTKPEEGIEIWVPIKYTLAQLTNTFKESLQSAMSYTGCRNLAEFKKVKWEYMTPYERNSYYK